MGALFATLGCVAWLFTLGIFTSPLVSPAMLAGGVMLGIIGAVLIGAAGIIRQIARLPQAPPVLDPQDAPQWNTPEGR